MEKAKKTGITGQAVIVFGGGISGASGICKDGSVTLAMRELKKPLNAGETIPEGADAYNFQVYMNFDNMKSLTTLRGWLDDVEDLLKGRNDEQCTISET